MNQEIKVHIDCPVCYSGNYFTLKNDGVELICEDCHYDLSMSKKSATDIGSSCIFCKCSDFFLEGLPGLKKSSVCYVCEAKYKRVELSNSDSSYEKNRESEIKKSKLAADWFARAEKY